MRRNVAWSWKWPGPAQSAAVRGAVRGAVRDAGRGTRCGAERGSRGGAERGSRGGLRCGAKSGTRYGARGDEASRGSRRRLLDLPAGHVSGMYAVVPRLISKRAHSLIEPAWCLDRRSWTDLASAAVHQHALNAGRIMTRARSRWANRRSGCRNKSVRVISLATKSTGLAARAAGLARESIPSQGKFHGGP